MRVSNPGDPCRYESAPACHGTDPSPRVLRSSVHIKRVELLTRVRHVTCNNQSDFYRSVHVGNVLRVAHARARKLVPRRHTRVSLL
jgi:hypothetical protein